MRRFKNRFEPKALRDEASNHLGASLVVQFFRCFPAQAPLERLVEHRVLVDLFEDRLHGLLRGVVIDAGLADFLEDSRSSAVFDGALHPRDRQRDPAVVERAIRLEARNRVVNLVASISRRLSRVRNCDSDSSRAERSVSAAI